MLAALWHAGWACADIVFGLLCKKEEWILLHASEGNDRKSPSHNARWGATGQSPGSVSLHKFVIGSCPLLRKLSDEISMTMSDSCKHTNAEQMCLSTAEKLVLYISASNLAPPGPPHMLL